MDFVSSKYKGQVAENIVAHYLKSKGLKVIDRNFWTKGGEIDIVARETSGKLLFFEVKSVSCKTIESCSPKIEPFENMHKKKLSHILKAISAYLRKNNLKESFSLKLALVKFSVQEKKAKIKIIDLI